MERGNLARRPVFAGRPRVKNTVRQRHAQQGASGMSRLSAVAAMVGVLGTATLAGAVDLNPRVQSGPRFVQVNQGNGGQFGDRPSLGQPTYLQPPTPGVEGAPPQPGVPPAPGSGVAPPHGVPMEGGPISGPPVEMFPHVKYKDRDEMAPCAVPMVVQVPDPCSRCRRQCGCCEPCMVNIMICAPQHCCPPRVKIKRRGREYVFHFGDYHVDVRVKKGYIEVDYQD